MTQIQPIAASQYMTERKLIAAADAYRDSVAIGRNYLTKEEAAAPVYARVDNEMRGRVEQFELLANPPERFCAYVGKDSTLTVWTGLPIGRLQVTSRWPVRSYMSNERFAYRATMGGREYVGTGFGVGMSLSLRETAASKRNRESGK